MKLYTKILFILLFIGGCQSTYFLEIRRTIANDPVFVNAKVVVIDVVSEPADFSRVKIDSSSSRVVSKGKIELDQKVMSDVLAESLSFDDKSVLTIEEYQKITSGLNAMRPFAGFKTPKVDALLRLHVTAGLISADVKKEEVVGFYRKSRRCQYLKNPPKKYIPCQETENSAWDEIRTISGASGNAVVWYSGELFINQKDEFVLHRPISGIVFLDTLFEDERAMSQKVAKSLGQMILNEIGTMELKIRLEIDEGNHSDSIALLKAGKLEEAREILETVVVEPTLDSSTDYYNLGIIYHAYGEQAIASDYYAKAIATGGYKRMYLDALSNLRVLNAETTMD